MSVIIKKNLLVYFLFWILLIYIVTAFTFWFFELNKQNKEITELKLKSLSEQHISNPTEIANVEKSAKRKTAQYLGEGVFFLILIFAGAIYLLSLIVKRVKIVKQEQDLMMAITHELRTPLAVAKLNLETMDKRSLEPEIQSKLSKASLEEINRMDALCNNLLIVSQMESGKYAVEMESINWSKVLESTVKVYQQRNPEREFLNSIEPEIFVNADDWLLKLMCSNLIENAIKYSPKTAPIEVKLSQENNFAKMQIIDNGDGIPEKEREKIFEKHFRLGNEATKRSKGTGLGLHIVKQIVKKLQGKVSVSAHEPNGSIFAVTLNGI